VVKRWPRMGIHFLLQMCMIKWVSTGTRKGFRDQVEVAVKALEMMMIHRMGVHLVHKTVAHRIFHTSLTDSVQQMLKLHRMMDGQFLQYRGNWILSGPFSEAVFSGTWRARLIGDDAFCETGHMCCDLYLLASLQTHRLLQEYIELDFIDHLEVSAVVVEHLFQTRVPMTMHDTIKQGVKYMKAQNKSLTDATEKLESKVRRYGTGIHKLQQ
jgi:hypothetical protein